MCVHDAYAGIVTTVADDCHYSAYIVMTSVLAVVSGLLLASNIATVMYFR